MIHTEWLKREPSTEVILNNIVSQLRSRVANTLRPLAESATRSAANRIIDKAKIDPRITYPSYMSLDSYIDVERLKSLDVYLMEQIQQHNRKQRDELFHTGVMTIEANSPKRPGSKIIYLSKSIRPFNYMDLDKPELWTSVEAASEFPLLMDFIATLPFKQTARMMIMYDDGGAPVTAHRDHVSENVCHEFIWFRSNMAKPFYMLNHKTGEKLYVDSYSAWFDSVNQFHGADPHQALSVSIRVDGIFSDEFRKQIAIPPYNKASTPSLWACLSGNEGVSTRTKAIQN